MAGVASPGTQPGRLASTHADNRGPLVLTRARSAFLAQPFADDFAHRAGCVLIEGEYAGPSGVRVEFDVPLGQLAHDEI